MCSRPLVSIIIPVYNGGNYLMQAIDSALVQTYPRTEVLVINDGSTDNGCTEQIALGYGNRICYYFKENGGVASALNLGLKQMRGEWFAWLSHDDMFTRDRLTNDVQVMDTNPEARVLFCRVQTIDSTGKPTSTIRYPIDHVANAHDALILGGVNMCAMTIHRDCFLATGNFNEKSRTTQDTEMSLRLAATFPFYLGNNIGLLSREHIKRGTYSLNSEHRRDLLGLCQIIHDELTLQAFFPNLSDQPREQSAAWVWMGSQYLSFGSETFAFEAFDKALKAAPNIYLRVVTKTRIIILRLVKTVLNEHLRARLKNILGNIIIFQ
jgi:hypothetical protein